MNSLRQLLRDFERLATQKVFLRLRIRAFPKKIVIDDEKMLCNHDIRGPVAGRSILRDRPGLTRVITSWVGRLI